MYIVRPIAEPPFVETPEPGFGVVIRKLNEMVVQAEDRTTNYNKNIQDKLDELDTHVTAWIASSVTPIDQHLAKRGAIHGETKKTVGLSKKDNFRTATLAEQINYANVNAFVTPAGAKAALDANTGEFDLSQYQRNGVFQFASYYYPDDYPTAIPATPEPVRYTISKGRVPMLMNGDRVVYSPRSDEARYTRQSLFLGMPLKGSAGARLSEIVNATARYTGTNWNMTAGDATDSKVAFFRPLGDKQIYHYKTTLPLPAGNRNYLLYNRNAAAAYRGLGIAVGLAGTVLTLSHRFFYTNLQATDPTLTELIASGYLGQFDRMGATPVAAPANGSHAYDLKDFVTLPAGATIAADPDYPDVITTMLWNSVDYEIYLNVSLAVLVKNGPLTSKLVLSFTESIIPGTLVAGGNALFKTLGPRVKDTLDANLVPVVGSAFLTVNNPLDFNNITQSPGMVLNSGVVVKAISTKLGLRVKRYKTDYNGMKDWMMAQRPVVSPTDASMEVFAPSRHTPFGPLPERIIPVAHDGTITQHLVYGLDSATGLFSWSQLTWNDASIISTQTGDNVFGVRLPEVRDQVDTLGLLPKSLTVVVNKSGVGVGMNALAFTSANNYIGKSAVSYASKTLTVGTDVKVAVPTKLSIQGATRDVMDRAALLNPGVDPVLRVAESQMFAINATRALLIITDGVSYAEAMVVNYAIVDGLFTLDFKAAGGVNLKPVTPASGPVTPGNRVSGSGDGTWMISADLLCAAGSLNDFSFVLTRPFGNNYGDLSFSVTGINGATPVFSIGKLNPVRLYPGTQQFDLVEELLPPVMVPGKGVYQYDGSTAQLYTNTMVEIGGGPTKMDPFNINETGWVRIPSGGRVVIGGKAYILGEEFALKVGLTGTTYCYLVRYGDVIQVVGSTQRREVANNEVLFGIAVNGVFQQTKDYLVMSNHVVSATRQGSAIPCFIDDGADGPNQFFTHRDVF